MERQTSTIAPPTGVRPTRDHLEALVGPWELDGESIQMLEEPGTGVLMAVNARGEAVNPITVITRGSRRMRRASGF